MSPPGRAHLISLSLVLGLTVSLVWGQAPTHFTLRGVTLTGPIPITSVGIGTGASPSLICHTTSAANTLNTVWLFPDGSMITQVTTDVTATYTFIFRRLPTNNIVFLRRGPSVLSPGGEYCCGSATNVNERLCINLVVDCGTPLSISNGSPGIPTSTLLGETVTYTCSNGYQISPGVTMATVSCLATGNWETVTCLVVCGTPPSISNGSPGTPTSTLFRGTVTYTCNNGYQISPGVTMATASCLTTGNWETVTCLAICPDLQPLMNGAITYQLAGTVQLAGTTATHSCTSGYRLFGGTVRVCQSDRTWSGDTITCLAICPALQAITNGAISYSSADRLEGGTAVYSCTDGFLLSSGSTRTCEDSGTSVGVWNGIEPSCLAICPVLTNITNGVISYSASSRVENSVATYSCTMGLNLLWGPIRTCQNNHTWIGDEPYCQRTYVSLGSMTFASNNSNIEINSIGEGASNGGLTCFTDLPNCCNSSQGEWLFPNAMKVFELECGADIYMERGEKFIRLNRRNAVTSPAGEYCCVLPTVGGMETFCINVTAAAIRTPPHALSQCDATLDFLSAVVVILGLALILLAVIIAYLVLKQRRMGGVNLKTPDIPLTDKGQSSLAQIYDTVDVTYEGVDVPRPLKGSYEYSQCEAYAPTLGGGVVNVSKTHKAPVVKYENVIHNN